MTQYQGFGNLNVSNLGPDAIDNRVSGVNASGKYQEKLLLKQREHEAMLMENRLKKL